MYRKTFCLLFLLLFTLALQAQDTLSFGGVYDLPGAEVRATYTPVSPLAQRFTIEEVYRLPGTFYDPARLVALLPGVVQTNDQANHLSVRGNTPNANLWRLNGLAIVNPNHTANAGTFYDFPTLSGGGVNAISAQMLGNSGFLAGGLPVEYGYATGGTFDLRLRPGSKTRRKYQAQAGFIGFDLMAEGPIGASGKTSYLVNGRYSFTGLLADAGVDFGGEEIRFADLNAHLHHEWDGGEISAFAILGQSSNVFRGPDSTEQAITEQKELFDIDFGSSVSMYGVNLVAGIGSGVLKSGVAFSSSETTRNQDFSADRRLLDQNLNYSLINANVSFVLPIGAEGQLQTGVEFLSQKADYLNVVFPPTGDEVGILSRGVVTAISPFVAYHWRSGGHDLHIGIRGTKYGKATDEFVFEPRINYGLRFGGGNNLSVAFERVSQTPLSRLLIEGQVVAPFAPVNNQTSVGLSRKIGAMNTKATVFYQYTAEEYARLEGNFIYSANNILEAYPFQVLSATTATRRYGLELEFAGGRKTKGWYYRGSATFLRAETEQSDGEWARDRFSADYIGKLTIGREWNGKDQKDRIRTYGLNLALISHGGERYGEVIAPNQPLSLQRFFTAQRFTGGFLNTTGTYFRPDLRLYKTKTRAKTTTTLALDVQNAAGVQNLANVYYDAFLDRPNERYQLGLIPVLSYRIAWR